MSEIAPSVAEPEPINKDVLISDPIKFGNMLFGSLNVPISKNYQTVSQDDEVRAVCSYCSQFNDFIEEAYDALALKKARPGRASILWENVSKEDYSQVSPLARGLGSDDTAELIKEQKTRLRAIAHLYVLDELAITLVNELIIENDPARQKSA
ncbi:MAG: hypothetical protein ABSB12_03345 [Candidatus Saccharimonadales bacterium]|jgi:hypothetical protein